MKNMTVGVLAHVDAGKTTLMESILFSSHAIRRKGRVDNQDTFLDYDEQERSRGITIYSKQAGVDWNDLHIDFIDTPGHVDFSSEMERSLSVLDAAILLISGLDGVQPHTRTIWSALQHYQIPTLIFVNKMDAARRSKDELLEEIQKHLSDMALDFQDPVSLETAALADEALMNEYLESETIHKASLQTAFENRKLFPVYFGSALKGQGVEELLDGLDFWNPEKVYPEIFGARVYKISRDAQNNLLTHMKITGGTLSAKEKVFGEQKADQIRYYSGQGYTSVPQAQAGRIAAVKGLEGTYIGQGLGFEEDIPEPLLEACLNYQMVLPASADPVIMMGYMKALSLEDPSLDVQFDEETKAIYIKMMGAVQMEVLQKRIHDLSGFDVGFGTGRIVYKETILEPVYGYGHFEPLRHYAEVHVLLEPAKRGSGMQFSSRLSRDILSLNWQRSILNAMAEKEHKGVLGGFPLTDVKVTLVNGRAHNKHTEGGDFRQAANRAIRQGLKKAECQLLEPYYTYSLLIPADFTSRALFDLQSRNASVDVEENADGTIRISGKGPVRTLLNYQQEVIGYTKGMGRFSAVMDGYDLCQDPEPILAERQYDSEQDRWNPTGSVFCANGSGYYVDWFEVEDLLHIPIDSSGSSSWGPVNSGRISEEEMRSFFEKAGGQNRNAKKNAQPPKKAPKIRMDTESHQEIAQPLALPECLIVDGYNMIYGWPSLKEAARESLHAAREELISALINYQGWKDCSLIIVFDGYKAQGNTGSNSSRGRASIIYTPAGVSADSWIEKKVHDLKGKFRCVVATSDSLIQNSALGSGASRISARELERRIEAANAQAKAYRYHS